MSPAASPVDNLGSLSFVITADGSPIPADYQVASLETWCAVNTVPRARITLFDGAVETGDFPISSSRTFEPGTAVVIKAGYENELSPIFSGIVTAQRLEIPSSSASTLVVDLADTAIKLTVDRHNRVASQQTDSDLMRGLVSAAGLTADVAATYEQYETVIQYDATDWDTLVSRAAMNGMIVIVQHGTVKVATPDTSAAPALAVQFGVSLLELSAELDALSQVNTVGHPQVRGRLRFPGHAAATTGGTIELGGVGARFNGTHFIGAVHHEVRDGQWTTAVELGVRPEWQSDKTGLTGGAAPQLPAVSGLQTGLVLKIDEDPVNECRVQVRLPLTGSEVGVWARLASLYATNMAGAVFYPEVGDEVIVGFMNGEPRSPVVLGSVFSRDRAVPTGYEPTADNRLKAIVTRSKLVMSFDDTKKVITIRTPAGQAISIDDDQRLVSITDANGHSVTLDNGGITLDSARDLTLTSKGSITLSAGGDVAVRSSGGDVMVEGVQVALKAQTTLSAEGAATTEVKSSGITRIQGSLVQIN